LKKNFIEALEHPTKPKTTQQTMCISIMKSPLILLSFAFNLPSSQSKIAFLNTNQFIFGLIFDHALGRSSLLLYGKSAIIKWNILRAAKYFKIHSENNAK
jgi:hypothetical protein